MSGKALESRGSRTLNSSRRMLGPVFQLLSTWGKPLAVARSLSVGRLLTNGSSTWDEFVHAGGLTHIFDAKSLEGLHDKQKFLRTRSVVPKNLVSMLRTHDISSAALPRYDRISGCLRSPAMRMHPAALLLDRTGVKVSAPEHVNVKKCPAKPPGANPGARPVHSDPIIRRINALGAIRSTPREML
jgi:hypothetical protein